MPRTRVLSIVCLLLFGKFPLFGQNDAAINECSRYKKEYIGALAKTTVLLPEEDNYDVQYVKFDLILSNTTAYIQGNVTTTAKVVSDKLDTYIFELSDTMLVDSVKIDGTLRTYTFTAGIGKVPLALPISKETTFTAQVYYRGYPRNVADINFPGFHNAENITFSSVEPYYAHTWWPCKQSLTDKIDSVDMWATVPDSVKVGSNGTLAAVTAVGPGYHRYEWKERYPIDYYLISVAAGVYDEYAYQMHFSGSADSMLILNYGPATLLMQAKPMLDTTGLLVDYYSTLFGRYAFWKEKYGHSYTPSLVNMEHQTMTSTHLNRLTVIAHELTHQWFGDNVTCGSWKDIWLNEGFATYGQYLCYEHFNGIDSARQYMNTVHADVLSQTWGTVFCYDTTVSSRIFDGRLSYDKGCAVVHMLRYICGDEQFLNVLRTYQQQYAGKTAITEDLTHIAETALGQSLYAFFHQWIYCDGYPIYDTRWNQVSDAVYVHIDQTTSFPSSIAVFEMPVEVKLYSAQGDTIVKVYNNQPSQTFKLIINKIIDSISIDPNQWLLCKKGRPVKDISLISLQPEAKVFPNPVSQYVYITYKDAEDAYVVLYDLSGRKVLGHKLTAPSGTEPVDISLLPKTLYVYKVIDNGVVIAEGKVTK